MKNAYKTLYSKDSTGKIRVWSMVQEGNKYHTISGVKDGQLVVSEYTTVEGKNTGKKNETTAEEQAVAEIKSAYAKQLKHGYYENIKDVDKGCKYIEPILAKKYEDYADKVDLTKKLWGMQVK